MVDFLSTKAVNRPSVVIGTGTMGARIALMLATRGGEVRIFDRQEQTAQKAIAYIEKNLPAIVSTTKGGKAGSVTVSPTLEDALTNAWLVIEALPEKLASRQPSSPSWTSSPPMMPFWQPIPPLSRPAGSSAV